MTDKPAATGTMAEKIAAARKAVEGATGSGAPAPKPAPAGPAIAELENAASAHLVGAGDPDPIHFDPKAKLYHHRFHGANFVMPSGKVLTFLGGSYKTSKAEEIEELDKIANVPGSFIHTTSAPVIAQDEKQLNKDLKSGAEATFDVVNKLPAGAKTVPMPMSPPQVTNLTDADSKIE